MKFIFSILLLYFFLIPAAMQVSAQDDPNAQFVLVKAGNLSAQPIDIEVPVESGVLRLQFSVQFSGRLNLQIITPLGAQLNLDEPHISVTKGSDKQTIFFWDPRPGTWKMRLSGEGAFTASANVQGDLYICCAQFFYRNGIYTLDRFQPVRGSRLQAQAFASGFNLDTIEFLLVDEQGRELSKVKARQSDFSNPSSFTLLVEIPEVPFRFLARGRDSNGKVYNRVFYWLNRPLANESPSVQTENPANVIINAQTLQELSNTAVPGEIKVIRSKVIGWADEELLSEKGNPIGIRLKITIRFPVDGNYTPYPQLYPERITSIYTGAMSLRVHKSSVEPMPDGAGNQGQFFISGRASYKAGADYKFVIDMVPNLVGYNDQKKAFCLQTRAYSQPGLKEKYEREISGAQAYRFRFSITGTDLDGRFPSLTEKAYVPGAWYRSFVKEGVTDCP